MDDVNELIWRIFSKLDDSLLKMYQSHLQQHGSEDQIIYFGKMLQGTEQPLQQKLEVVLSIDQYIEQLQANKAAICIPANFKNIDQSFPQIEIQCQRLFRQIKIHSFLEFVKLFKTTSKLQLQLISFLGQNERNHQILFSNLDQLSQSVLNCIIHLQQEFLKQHAQTIIVPRDFLGLTPSHLTSKFMQYQALIPSSDHFLQFIQQHKTGSKVIKQIKQFLITQKHLDILLESLSQLKHEIINGLILLTQRFLVSLGIDYSAIELK